MATPEEIREAISDDAAQGISRVQVAGESVDMMSIEDRQKAMDIEASATAVTKPHFGVRFGRIVPPGCG